MEHRMRITVYFEDPFWVAVLERESGGALEACKLTFGAEPRDAEIYAFLLRTYSRLTFSPALPGAGEARRAENARRARRAAEAMLRSAGIGTKAQQALQLQREQAAREKKETSRTRDEAEAERRFQLRQEKKKQKHRGH